MAPYTRGQKQELEGFWAKCKEEKEANEKYKSTPTKRHRKDESKAKKAVALNVAKSSAAVKPRLRWMKGDVLKTYMTQVNETDGFDVEDFSEYASFNMIVPIGNDDLEDIEQGRELKKLSNRAITYYRRNMDKDAKLKFVRVVKANSRGGGIWEYFITFEAKDIAADNQIKTFQAWVHINYADDHAIEVKFCRLKLTPSTTSTSTSAPEAYRK